MAKISLGRQEFVELGNLNAKRDWGHAKEYVNVREFGKIPILCIFNFLPSSGHVLDSSTTKTR